MAYVKSQRTGRGKTGFKYFDDKGRSGSSEQKRIDLITELYAGDIGVKKQLEILNARLNTKYGMTSMGHEEMLNGTVADIYSKTYHVGQGQYILFMCKFVSGVDTENHFMAIDIGAVDCAFFDPNEGEIRIAHAQFWNVLHRVMTATYLKAYFPNNIVSLDRFFKF